MTAVNRNRDHTTVSARDATERASNDDGPPPKTLDRKMLSLRFLFLGFLFSLCQIEPAIADDLILLEVTIKDHRFTPSEIHVPAGKPSMLTIRNEDSTPEEFDSAALKVEKVVTGGRSASVRLRPLGAGRYPFVGEYHADTAHGVVISE